MCPCTNLSRQCAALVLSSPEKFAFSHFLKCAPTPKLLGRSMFPLPYLSLGSVPLTSSLWECASYSLSLGNAPNSLILRCVPLTLSPLKGWPLLPLPD